MNLFKRIFTRAKHATPEAIEDLFYHIVDLHPLATRKLVKITGCSASKAYEVCRKLSFHIDDIIECDDQDE